MLLVINTAGTRSDTLLGHGKRGWVIQCRGLCRKIRVYFHTNSLDMGRLDDMIYCRGLCHNSKGYFHTVSLDMGRLGDI